MPQPAVKPPTSSGKKALWITLAIIFGMIIFGFFGLLMLGKFIYNNFSPVKTTAPIVNKVKASAERILAENNYTTLQITSSEQSLVGRRTTKSAAQYIITNTSNTPNFRVDTIQVSGQSSTPASYAQNEAAKAKVAELLKAELPALGLTAIDTYTQPDGPIPSTTTVYSVSGNPDVICNFTPEFVNFDCAHTLSLEATDTLIAPLAVQYATVQPVNKETVLAVSPVETGKNNYEIVKLYEGAGARFFYRQEDTQDWTMAKVQLSVQSMPSCAELKPDPNLIMAMNGFSSDPDKAFSCVNANNQSVPVTPLI
jgi:hypothetical protein